MCEQEIPETALADTFVNEADLILFASILELDSVFNLAGGELAKDWVNQTRMLLWRTVLDQVESERTKEEPPDCT